MNAKVVVILVSLALFLAYISGIIYTYTGDPATVWLIALWCLFGPCLFGALVGRGHETRRGAAGARGPSLDTPKLQGRIHVLYVRQGFAEEEGSG